jgi:hypothetical protein
MDTSTVSASLCRRSTGTHNPGIELEPLHSYATYTEVNLRPDYVEDNQSTTLQNFRELNPSVR